MHAYAWPCMAINLARESPSIDELQAAQRVLALNVQIRLEKYIARYKAAQKLRVKSFPIQLRAPDEEFKVLVTICGW